MTSPAIKDFTYFVIASVSLLCITLLPTSSAHAQVAISNDGVTFPDDTEQTSAVIIPMNCPHGDSIVWDTSAANWTCLSDLSDLTCGNGIVDPGEQCDDAGPTSRIAV